MEQKISLEKSEKFVSNLINTLGNPIFVKDKDHRWILLNDAFCDFMGYKRGELLGKSDYDFFPKQEADIFWKKDEEVFRSEKPNINEENFTDKKGQTHVILTKKVLYKDESGDPFIVGVITDITELRKKTEELEKMNKFMVGRELKMTELKKEIEELKKSK